MRRPPGSATDTQGVVSPIAPNHASRLTNYLTSSPIASYTTEYPTLRQAITKVRLLSAAASFISSPDRTGEYMRELHVWENPLLHGGLATDPCRENVYDEPEYDWWNFNERGDLLVGVTEPTAVDEFGNVLSYTTRTVWIIARGMYAKVWENVSADEPTQEEEEEPPYGQVTDEDRFEVPTFAETATAASIYFSDNARAGGDAKIFELPTTPSVPQLDLALIPEPLRARFAGNATLYLPQRDQLEQLDEFTLPELPALEPPPEPEPEPPPESESEPEPPPKSSEPSTGFLLNPTIDVPLVLSKQE